MADVGVCSIGYDELIAVVLLRQQRGHLVQPAPGLWNGRAGELRPGTGELLLVTFAEVRPDETALRQHRPPDVCNPYTTMAPERAGRPLPSGRFGEARRRSPQRRPISSASRPRGQSGLASNPASTAPPSAGTGTPSRSVAAARPPTARSVSKLANLTEARIGGRHLKYRPRRNRRRGASNGRATSRDSPGAQIGWLQSVSASRCFPSSQRPELLDAIAAGRGLGYSPVTAADEIYHKDAWLLFAAAAQGTERIRLGRLRGADLHARADLRCSPRRDARRAQ